MKKTSIQNNNGITVCDSIVMSVKRRSLNLRKAESAAIAVCGMVAVLKSFFGMFDFYFDSFLLFCAVIGFSVLYITLSVLEGRALWILTASIPLFVFCAYKSFDAISNGLKYVYNIIYSTAYDTSIDYYKRLDPENEEQCVTTLFIFAVWLLAIVIYYFTICRPNPILPLLVTFPIIEIGLYHGIEIPVFWGVLVVAYWISLLGMSTIDVGEYSGGFGSFVRKDNLFFPKRQMKLKITEKCGVFIIAVILTISFIASSVMKITDYERSDEINQKRKDITEAFNEFSIDDLPSSLQTLSNAFGLELNMKSNKLGSMSSIKYKNTTDFTATFSGGRYDNAIYIKNNVLSLYDDNEWKSLDDEAYDADVFDDFEKYGIYPQDIPALINKAANELFYSEKSLTIDNKDIKSSLSPYGTINSDGLDYTNDTLVSDGDKKQHYTFTDLEYLYILDTLRYPSNSSYSLEISDSDYSSLIIDYCIINDIGFHELSSSYYELIFRYKFFDWFDFNRYPDALLAMLIEDKYSQFVYENYLEIPHTAAMDEVREAYSDVVPPYIGDISNQEKLRILNNIRNKIDDTSVYTLSPGKTPRNRDFVNHFLLESHKGYCVHYATAGVILARMAGIPARYATGYIVTPDDFNTQNSNGDGSYSIDVMDNRSHAWAEVYLDGIGWVPFEFTSGYSGSSGSQTTSTAPRTTVTTTTTVSVPSSSTSKLSGGSRTTAMITSTTSPFIMAPVSDDGGDSDGIKIPPVVKKILAVIIPFALLIAFILIRRSVTVSSRRRRMTTGSGTQRIGHIYNYTGRLLSEIGIERCDRQYLEFAEYAENCAAGKYFPSESFTKMTGLALLSAFGNTPPSGNELKECLAFADNLAENVYKNNNIFGRLSLKYLKCVI